jgi:hypothetical protein
VWLTAAAGLIAAGTGSLLMSQVVATSHPTRTGWFITAVAILLFGAVLLAVGLLQTIRQWWELRQTPFEIVHKASEDQCRQIERGKQGVQFRIKVRNHGRYGLSHVRVRMIKKGGYDHWIRIRHDNTVPYERSLNGEVLPADTTYWAYFDVAFFNPDGPVPLVWLEFADEYLRGESAQSDDVHQHLTFVVWGSREDTGRGVREERAEFDLVRLPGGREVRLIDLRPAPTKSELVGASTPLGWWELVRSIVP